jgi:hypothetical protein
MAPMLTPETCNVNVDNLCAPNHRGPLCQVCTENHYRPTKGSLCTQCGGASSIASFAVTGSLVFGFVGCLFAWLYLRRLRRRHAATGKAKTKRPPSTGRPTLRRALWRRLRSESLRNKLKLVISLFRAPPRLTCPALLDTLTHTVPSAQKSWAALTWFSTFPVRPPQLNACPLGV